MQYKIKVKKLRTINSTEKAQIKVYTIISIVVITFTGILYLINPCSFYRFFGDINPLILVPIFIVLVLIILRFFLSKGWFKIYSKENQRKMLRFYPIALLLASIAILIDVIFKYPEYINILFPESLLFYPVIGFVAEAIFHIIPLCLLLLFFNTVFKKLNLEKYMWVFMLIVSIIEPLFQAGTIPEHFPLWTSVYMSLHLYIFNSIQLYFFKRYDFFSIYSFRLGYYLLWHIIWGYIRLRVLF